ncbi:MAG TPA: TIGR01459 family HAD-type hydrolase [Mesorhizobium sp.]|nr:TIGR01459 family HAD-type hydrolase [Mesorhizobium sp.]
MHATNPLNMIEALDGLAERYRVILSDVWGVVHNGVEASVDAAAALARARRHGLAVVLITNAPRPHPPIVAQLDALGVGRDSWDRLVSSGDVTRELIRHAPRLAFHLGPERDVSLYEGLDVELVEEGEADVVICTGFFDDEAETPEDYADMLRRFRGRNLPFICANPDVVVERGERLIWCAGALARDYAQLGGRTSIAGKPFAPIYEEAFRQAADVLGRPVEKDEVLAVGDGMLTDVKGAADFGLDVLYVSGGIHWRDYGDASHVPDPDRLLAFLTKHGQRPVAVMAGLR